MFLNAGWVKGKLSDKNYVPVGLLLDCDLKITQINSKNYEPIYSSLKRLGLSVGSLEGLINDSINSPSLDDVFFTSVGFSKRYDVYKVRLTFYGSGVHLLRVIDFDKNSVKVRLSYSAIKDFHNYLQSVNKDRFVDVDFLKKGYEVVNSLNH